MKRLQHQQQGSKDQQSGSSMNEEQTKNLQDYLAAFRRRRAQIAAIFVVIFGIGAY